MKYTGSIILSGNRLSEKGSSAILQNVRTTTVTSIDLSNNQLGVEACHLLQVIAAAAAVVVVVVIVDDDVVFLLLVGFVVYDSDAATVEFGEV